jgi:hypothetical protein
LKQKKGGSNSNDKRPFRIISFCFESDLPKDRQVIILKDVLKKQAHKSKMAMLKKQP